MDQLEEQIRVLDRRINELRVLATKDKGALAFYEDELRRLEEQRSDAQGRWEAYDRLARMADGKPFDSSDEAWRRDMEARRSRHAAARTESPTPEGASDA
jgi:hypothetical protein